MGSQSQETKKVILHLVDIADNVSKDPSGTEIKRLVRDELVCTTACFAATFLHKKDSYFDDQNEISIIQKQILKYLQVKDKYAALASTILKSRVFHMAHNNIKNNDAAKNHQTSLPIVELPRTPHNKPYIPISSCLEILLPANCLEEDVYSFSISHQHPFVGCAHLEFGGQKMTTNANTDTSPLLLKVGLDIVIFEDFNPKLYNNQQEFLQVFRSSFSEWEWGRIFHANTNPLYEFYLRWAMKEAYTKAQGSGMGIAFDSFDIRLLGVDGVDDDDDDSGTGGGVWSHVYTTGRELEYKHYLGTVMMDDTAGDDNAAENTWEIHFLPLKSTTSSENAGQSEEPIGCACICVGPHSHDKDASSSKEGRYGSPRNPLEVHRTSLKDLMKWHASTCIENPM
jgi:phosphopantetheinyl transferase